MIDFAVPPKIQRSADHRYTFNGVTYPGVTSVLKVIDKSDALMAWAARQTAEAAIGMLSPEYGNETAPLVMLMSTVGPEGVVKALTSRSSWKRDEAAQLGTDVHDLADQLMRGLSPEIPDHARKHVQNYADWLASAGWTLRASEAMLVNPEWGYGGTLDLLAYDRDGKTVIADIKTGRSVYREAVLQLTAYSEAQYLQREEHGQTQVFTMPRPDRYVILHVTADSPVREVEVNVGALEKVAWGACLDLYQWTEATKGKRL
jgi:hypothetical protein